MKDIILVLGNEYIIEDSLAKKIALKLDHEFLFIKDSFQLLEVLKKGEKFIILNVIKGLKEPKIVPLVAIKENSVVSAHDFDAGFVLKLSNKKYKIIGLPQTGNFDEILRKVEVLLDNNLIT